MTEMKLLRFSA